MNFKFTKKKVIWSLIINLIIWALFFIIIRSIMSRAMITDPGTWSKYFELINPINSFSSMNFQFYVITLILIYIIYSLFQKK